MNASRKILTYFALICLVFFIWTKVIVWQSEKKYPPIGSFIELENQKLHYVKAGQGQPLVLLHGDGGSVYDWTMSCFDTLAKHYTTIAIDRPGLGYSSTLPNQSIQAQAEFLHQCLQKLSTEKPILICHSRGAEVGTYLGIKHPGSIAGLITLGGACVNTEKQEPSWQYKLLLTPGLGWFIANTFYVPFSNLFIKAGLDKAFSPDRLAPQDYIDAYAAQLMKPQQFINWAKDQDHSLLENFLIPNYKNIKTPMVIINGEKDNNLTLTQAKWFQKQISHSKLLIIPDTGHELHFNKPSSIFMAIDSLKLSKVP